MQISFIEIPTKIRDWKMLVSGPERAILEIIDEIKDSEENFIEASELMEALTVLRLEILQSLLESCKKIVVKRTFLFLAKNSGHRWVNKLDLSKIYLGKGKRQIIKGGALDKDYEITVPQKLADYSKSDGLF